MSKWLKSRWDWLWLNIEKVILFGFVFWRLTVWASDRTIDGVVYSPVMASNFVTRVEFDVSTRKNILDHAELKSGLSFISNRVFWATRPIQ